MTRITMFTLSGLILVTVVHCVIGTGKNYISFILLLFIIMNVYSIGYNC